MKRTNELPTYADFLTSYRAYLDIIVGYALTMNDWDEVIVR